MSDQSISLRPATGDDQDFLRAVFASTRAAEVAALGGEGALAASFVDMQFRIQQQSYGSRYPAADNYIISIDDCPAGRLLVDRSGNAQVLVDIALLNDFRNRGIGSFLIRRLMNEAAAENKPVRLSVLKFNPALRLYQRLGFSIVADENLYLQMEWLPDTRSENERR